jgi:hypothetical protein
MCHAFPAMAAGVTAENLMSYSGIFMTQAACWNAAEAHLKQRQV